ncbi:MAG TPA: hypothetical protein VF093_07870 [Solirubrobacterales bacterium]
MSALSARGARTWLLALVAVGVTLFALAGTADAIKVHLRLGDLLITGEGGVTPTRLPKDRDAPITIYGGGTISTVSGAYPPVIKDINFEFDKHGSVVTTGLPVCTSAKLQATTVAAARKNCPGAIVGKGFGRGVVVFPEQPAIPVSSPITLFNGPKKGGNDTVFAHFYTTVPAPVAFVIPIVIQKISKGVYGYRTEARIPPIAGGNGIPLSGHLTIGKKWTYKGKRYSYVNARCATGRLQARGEFGFRDGTLLKGTFFQPCQVKRDS